MTHQRQTAAKNRNGRRWTQPAALRRIRQFAGPITVRRTVEDAASMLCGVGFGAALMYLLDPQSGRSRRSFIADEARQRISGASQALTGRAREAMDYASDELSNRGARAINEVRGSIPETWRHRASNWLKPEHHYIAPAAGITVGGIALVALGAGLAFFLDPYRGRARRHVAGELVRRTGRRISHREPFEPFEHQDVSEMESEPAMSHREAEPNEI